MNKILIEVKEDIFDFYNDIANITNKPIEEVLQDTLNNTYDLFLRHSEQVGNFETKE